MTDKLQVKEHLRNPSLYQPVTESSLSGEWKRKLFYQYTLHQQLNNALQEKNLFLKWFVCIGVPVICITFAFAVYFGFIQPENWFNKITGIAGLDITSIDLKETLIFVAIVNGLILFVRKREILL